MSRTDSVICLRSGLEVKNFISTPVRRRTFLRMKLVAWPLRRVAMSTPVNVSSRVLASVG